MKTRRDEEGENFHCHLGNVGNNGDGRKEVAKRRDDTRVIEEDRGEVVFASQFVVVYHG
ncbi:hypothetical protein HPP92_028620 [Vanilla planifolia]|uniref:Uncharacterized protein n=1 Tax=Vanilla planifolia TaxID=51239 RepID=A0A835PA96_VANPL|nr:hypothetical protein HPP92_028620 [Vanilla planifolia]KAG0446927.1 hypothetical protein HPP92_028615 [Vanilla planifolia]